MKTGVILTGVVALASAAPAATNAKDASVTKAAVVAAPVNGTQDGDWYVVFTSLHQNIN